MEIFVQRRIKHFTRLHFEQRSSPKIFSSLRNAYVLPSLKSEDDLNHRKLPVVYCCWRCATVLLIRSQWSVPGSHGARLCPVTFSFIVSITRSRYKMKVVGESDLLVVYWLNQFPSSLPTRTADFPLSLIFFVLGMTLNCIHIFIVTGSFLYWCVMRPARQRFFIHICIYLRILIISYLATFLGINSLSVLMCRKAVNQSITDILQNFNQSRSNSIWPEGCPDNIMFDQV